MNDMASEHPLYPEQLSIEPLTRSPKATVRVPGSKSITNRALVMAALSGVACELHGALQSEDTEIMVQALQALGFSISPQWSKTAIQVGSRQGSALIPACETELFLANSGTSMRFLTAFVSLGKGRYRLDGVPRMRERPITDLLSALQQLGVRAYSERNNGCPPVIVEAEGLNGGTVDLKGDVSSQFLSGLLMAAACARKPVTIRWKGPYVSWPYVLMTAEMMHQFGAAVLPTMSSSFVVPAPQQFGRTGYTIEPDASAASYYFAAAALTGGEIRFPQLGSDEWPGYPHRHTDRLQGDWRFGELLEEMGCQVHRGQNAWMIRGGPLRGIDVDMNDISDTVMTLAAVACFAEGPTTIRNIAHIRHKETDRLAALATELRRVGAGVEEFRDGLTITPRPLHGAEIETYKDHRMAMSMALIGLRVPGIVIKDPGCVAKTYPQFFTDLERLRAETQENKS
jgi:3-phosphoshikimate 1-carboxyvinyltransferase